MADDSTSLLLRIRGDSSGGKAAVAETRAAISSLRSSASTEFGHMQSVSNAALGSINSSVTNLAGRVPILGSTFQGLTSNLASVAAEGEAAGGALAAMGGPIGLAIAGIAATAVAVVSLNKGLFQLAEAAADFRGKLFDLSQQTGVSVETLSALEVIAKTTGGSIDSIAQSLVIFQGKLDEAQDSSSKAGKQFRELGISTTDTETAFRDALRQLAQMPEGFKQTNDAAELFGRRGGKQVLAMLKEMHGDLDGTIERLRELGIVISKEDAKAADEFNDQLALLGIQLRSQLGKEAIPAALEAVKSLSRVIQDNKVAIDGLRVAVGGLATLFGGTFRGTLALIGTQWATQQGIIESVADAYERIARASGLIKPVDFGTAIGGVGGNAPPEFGADISFGGSTLRKGQKDVRKAALDESTDTANKELELQRHLTEQLRLEHERRGGEIAAFYQKQQTLADEHLETLNKQIEREREINRQAFAVGGITQAEFDNAQRDLTQRATEAKNKHDEDIARLTLEKNRAEVQEELTHRKRLFDIAQAGRDGELSRIKAALSVKAITEADALTQEIALRKQAQKERIGIIDFELNADKTRRELLLKEYETATAQRKEQIERELAVQTLSAERKAELDTAKTISEREYTDEFKRLTSERIDAANREQAASGPGSQGVGTTTADDIARQAGAAADLEAGFPPPAPIIDPWKEALSQLKEMGLDAVESLAAGVGNLTQQWVLYGSVGPNAVRKMVASVLAALAAQAAVESLMELAKGFAALANPFTAWEAPLHFHAAALFAAVAAGSAIAGRLIAGNSFQSGGGSSGKSAGGGNTTTGGATGSPSSQDTNRLVYQQPVIQVHLHGEAAAAFKYKVIDVIVDDHRDNGRVRAMVETGQV